MPELPESRRVLIAGIAFTVVGFALAAWSGTLAANPGEYDWGVAATVGTAVGTTALALATGCLAWVSATELRTTRGLLVLQERDEKRKDSAYLRLVNPIAIFSGSMAQCEVTIINAGLSAAFDIAVRFDLFVSRQSEARRDKIGLVQVPVLVAGEVKRISIPRFDMDVTTAERFPLGVDWHNLGVSTSFHDRNRPDGSDDPPIFDVAEGRVEPDGSLVKIVY